MVGRGDVVPTILEIALQATGMGVAAINRIDKGRWIVLNVRDAIGLGLEIGDEFEFRTMVRDEITRSAGLVAISGSYNLALSPSDASRKRRRIGSYMSHPIFCSDDALYGILCVLDVEVRDTAAPEKQVMLRLLAELIGLGLRQAGELEDCKAELTSHHETAELREQFIAVMGHDLRNPLAAIRSGIGLIEKQPPQERMALILAQMRSSAARMTSLIADVLDLARGRLGDGMILKREPVFVDPIIDQVVAELAGTHPNHMIAAECSFAHAIYCDPDRFAQLLSNLLGNALTHGAAEQVVRLLCESTDDSLLLSVTNGGVQISEDAMKRLFQPFVRGRAQADRDGLGLGLYIASEIAAAHGGKLSVTSTAEETRFSFEMPLVASTGQTHQENSTVD